MPAEYAEQCPVLCNADPALANVVNDAADCAALVGMVSQGEPVLEALCAEPPMGLTCEQVCTRIGRDCIPGGGSPQEIAQCAQACNADMPTPAQLQCGLTAECNDVEACEDLQDPQATCEQVCARIGRDCIPGGGSPQEIAQCAQACNADMPTPEQLQCGLTAQCNDVPACQGPPQVTCEQVCARIGRDCIPGGGSPQEIARCAQACNADMPTPAQLQCGLTAQCNDVQACQVL